MSRHKYNDLKRNTYVKSQFKKCKKKLEFYSKRLLRYAFTFPVQNVNVG